MSVTKGKLRTDCAAASITVMALVLAALVVTASPARASFGIEPGSYIAKTHATVPLLNSENVGCTSPLHACERVADIAGIAAASPIAQAGAHPDASASFSINHVGGQDEDNPKDISVNLPPGFIGDPDAVPACGRSAFEATFRDSTYEGPNPGGCSPASQVGVASILLSGLYQHSTSPVYRIATAFGSPASFGFAEAAQAIELTPSLRSDSDYGLTVEATNIDSTVSLLGSTVTFWGVPAESIHNAERWNPETQNWGASTDLTPQPFLSNPTYCGSGPLNTAISMDSWQEAGRWLPEGPGDPFYADYQAEAPEPTGCGSLRFGGPGAEASLAFQPAVHTADTPSGYSVKLSLPYNENPDALANPTLRDTRVTLPEGVVLNPSAANGLEACSLRQIGYLGGGFPLPNPIHFNEEPIGCPDASKIGTVEIDTPLLEKPLDGAVYLARQYENPFDSLLAIYIAIDDEETGIVVKLAGHVETDPVTGRLTTTFTNSPQLPFTELNLDLFGGATASLVNPVACGTETTTSELTPWSAPESGPPVVSSDSFQIDEGCAARGFAPSFTAGTTNNQAGAFSPFSVAFSRSDGDQDLGGVTVQTPRGLLGDLAGVPLCGEAQANAGTCSAASQIGHVTVGAGVGPDPVFLPVAGQPENPVYLTGPYKGAPFGLSVVVPAIAGPFNLGTVVVRAAISVDPHTAQVTISSDPLPTILDGIPLQVRSVNVVVDRAGFMFNPTDCAASAVGGTLISTQGTAASVSSRFQAANCASLKFTPRFSASTSAKTSKAGGASLTTRVVEPSEPQGSQANIARVKVELPKALPSRLTTLQKACLAVQFEAEPAGCPAASMIGTASVDTPVLPVPLTGPAIFVSHGGEAFPSLTLVLQGDGVTIDLVGTTFISKAGITSTTFKSVPDAPFSTFALTLPEGRYSALTANGNLCTKKLVMPTEFVGQNGAQIKQSTPIEVEGCSNALSFISHKIKKRTLTLSVYAPAAGRLTVGGRGVRSKAKTVKQRGAVTFRVKQERAGRLKTTVRATFTPSTGKDRKKQVKSLKVKFRK